jgi:hypothetical protein
MKVGDLVEITLLGEYNMDDPWISEGDKAIVLDIYYGMAGWTKGEVLHKIALVKDGHVIEHLLDTEIKTLNKTNTTNV